MLKRILTVAISLFLVTPAAIAVEAVSEAQFTSNLRAAISEKDDQKLQALIQFDGASPQDKQRMTSMLRMTLMNGKDVDEITLVPLPSDFDSVIVFRGQKIEPTATPKGMIKVTFKGTGQGPKESSSAYTVVDGKFFLVGMKSTIGQALALATGGSFFDGDDFYPPDNVEKMRAGISLTDFDRQDWL